MTFIFRCFRELVLPIGNVGSSNRMCSIKKVPLKVSQNSQENISATVSFFIKLQAWGLVKDRFQHRCFSMNFLKILRTPFLYRKPPAAFSELYIGLQNLDIQETFILTILPQSFLSKPPRKTTRLLIGYYRILQKKSISLK